MSESVVFDHLRGSDGEHVGYIEMTPAGRFIPYDRLRRPCGTAMDLEDAEAVLDETGLRMLAEDWLLDTDDGPVPVRIVEVGRTSVVVVRALATASSVHVAKALDLTDRITVPLPAAQLRSAQD